MSIDPISPPPRPLPALLTSVKLAAIDKLRGRIADAGHPEIREGHGCVFGFIDIERGSRLTDLAANAGFTKQAVGEAVTELERLGYVTREPDPRDRRAKIIKLTDRGMDAVIKGRRIFAEIEQEWAKQVGPELMASFREAATRIAALEGAPTESGAGAGERRAA
jgi:DNA-binding MarR family transcriptional regulator